jgi:hypothetical protein
VLVILRPADTPAAKKSEICEKSESGHEVPVLNYAPNGQLLN